MLNTTGIVIHKANNTNAKANVMQMKLIQVKLSDDLYCHSSHSPN